MLEAFLSSLPKDVPNDVVLRYLSDGGTIAGLVLLAVIVIPILWKAVEKVLSERLEGYLRQVPWLMVFLLYLVSILLSLMTQRYWSALLIGLCGPSIWVAYHKLPLPPLRLTVIIALVVLCVIAYQVEGWHFARQIHAYVVLSFERSGSAEDKFLLALSREYRSILEEAFHIAPF